MTTVTRTRVAPGAESEVSPYEIADECDIGDRDCRDRVNDQAAAEAQEETDEEFDEILAAAVEVLEEEL